jgi:transcriptional regulator with XRE-family HTH domain
MIYSYGMKDESKKLGKNLKRIRIKKDITQIEIARRLGVDRSFVSNIENGKNNPTLSTITSLAKALDVPSTELLK